MTLADLASYLPAGVGVGAIAAIVRVLILNRVPLRKVKLEGEEALWDQIWKLHDLCDRKAKEYAEELKREREDCDRRISHLEGQIRQIMQRSRSLGSLAGSMDPLGNELSIAFPLPTDDMPMPRPPRRIVKPKPQD